MQRKSMNRKNRRSVKSRRSIRSPLARFLVQNSLFKIGRKVYGLSQTERSFGCYMAHIIWAFWPVWTVLSQRSGPPTSADRPVLVLTVHLELFEPSSLTPSLGARGPWTVHFVPWASTLEMAKNDIFRKHRSKRLMRDLSFSILTQ